MSKPPRDFIISGTDNLHAVEINNYMIVNIRLQIYSDIDKAQRLVLAKFLLKSTFLK